MAQKKKLPSNIVASNKRARFNYQILEVFEAGLILKGTEVKAIREGKVSINDAFATDQHGELYLQNAYFADYSKSVSQHETRAPRKLLLHKREISKILGSIQRKGRSVVPLSLYFNRRGLAKVQLAEVIGKKLHDKRETIKQRDWDKQKARLLREKN